MISARPCAPFVAAALALTGLVAVAPPAAAAASTAGSYVAVTPKRVLDSRTGGAHLGPARKVSVRVTGASGVPADAAAVALTITALAPQQRGSLTAATHGAATRPNITTVSFDQHRNATGLTVVRPGAGLVDIWGSGGRVGLVVDVLGYYVGGAPAVDGALHLITPKRAVRFNGSRIAAGGALDVDLGSAAGLPADAGAVAATVTVVGPARSGSLVAYATNTTRPAAPLVDFTVAKSSFTNPHSVSQFGVLPVSDIQGLTLVNRSKGSLHVVVDVLGWFGAGPAATAHTQQVVAANRIFQDGRLPAHQVDAVGVLGRGGVPRAGVSAVVVSARISGATRSGTLVGGSGAAPIVASFGAGQRVTGQAILQVHNGKIRLHNTADGRLALEVDVVGYVVSATLTPPSAVSVARYPNDLTGSVGSDSSLMTTHGNTDGDAGATFVLLDLGAQSVTSPLSHAHPGVAITRTDPVVRYTYPQLISVLDAYLTALGQHSGGRHVTVAIGTNNDGDWAGYRAAARGRDWANLIDGLSPPANVAVIGADDIESNFASTEAQAQTWENAYFANTTADLVFNGALNDCPTVFGDGAACAFGWTQQQYWQLAHHVEHGRNRTRVLPQIYLPVQAVQWANVFAHGGGGLQFVGSLTEFAADDTTFEPVQGWAALYRALQWQLVAPHVPRVVDIGAAA